MARNSKNKVLKSLIDDFDKCLSELLAVKDKFITGILQTDNLDEQNVMISKTYGMTMITLIL